MATIECETKPIYVVEDSATGQFYGYYESPRDGFQQAKSISVVIKEHPITCTQMEAIRYKGKWYVPGIVIEQSEKDKLEEAKRTALEKVSSLNLTEIEWEALGIKD